MANTILHKAESRGNANHGWLHSRHTFSFANYYNPERTHFGVLRVLNDDRVEAGMGFGTHPHDNMEIISIPLEGDLEHKDSMGNVTVIKNGDVQIMSAGSGVRHSEANVSATDPLTLFQIWIFPKVRNIEPRYDQRSFDVAERINQWQIVVSPREEDKALWINQDARFALTKLEAGRTINYANAFPGNGVYLVNISGKVQVNDTALHKRDAMGITESDQFTIVAEEDSELLVIEVPMR